MSGHYVYSLDRQTFLGQFASRSDALRAALTAAKQQPEPPTEVYVALKIPGNAQSTGHAEDVIRRMSDRARAASAQASADGATRYLQNVNEQEEADLDDMLARTINKWLIKHDRMPTFYNVEAISEHPVPNPAPAPRRSEEKEVTEIGTADFP